MSIIKEIRCAHCGAPVEFQPGEIITTCRYCGFTQVIETGDAFTFDHSMFLNEYDAIQVETLVDQWMEEGFAKPSGLAKKSKITEKDLTYVPFWILNVEALTAYKGVFERLTPPVVKEGKIQKHYDWVTLARKGTRFPTREYDVPLEGKIPYDFRKIEKFAKVLNSEIERDEAAARAKQEIEAHHQFLAKQEVDKILEIQTDFELGEAVYLHAPIWFIVYEFKKKKYRILIDGATGTTIEGEIPPLKIGLF
jgi:DNA-directed RNA polymerase subunit RPC12/RpoP